MIYPRYHLKDRVAYKLNDHILVFGVINAVVHKQTEEKTTILYTVENSYDSAVIHEDAILSLDYDYNLEQVSKSYDLFLDRAIADAEANNAVNEPPSGVDMPASNPPTPLPF